MSLYEIDGIGILTQEGCAWWMSSYCVEWLQYWLNDFNPTVDYHYTANTQVDEASKVHL